MIAVTDRQFQVADYVQRGYTNKEIAKELGITERTVKAHTHNLYTRLSIPKDHIRRVKLATLMRNGDLCNFTEEQNSQTKNSQWPGSSLLVRKTKTSDHISAQQNTSSKITSELYSTSSDSATELSSRCGTNRDMMINPIIAATVAQEYCMPSYTQDGGIAVAFFKGMQNQIEFCIPVSTEQEAIALAIRFQEIFCKAIARYQELDKCVTG